MTGKRCRRRCIYAIQKHGSKTSSGVRVKLLMVKIKGGHQTTAPRGCHGNIDAKALRQTTFAHGRHNLLCEVQ
ncbi:hypothetical protein NDU88_004488 [Pleurodeles waltl]|uniref:Uncharacterized protein n=1 Tax=Pleurodeles waltl TaxID=8319 RepID=A0AAV7RL49_PLEWA|nr:hypothetical protein NDU88_004488 [Pleurodeles waltl]